MCLSLSNFYFRDNRLNDLRRLVQMIVMTNSYRLLRLLYLILPTLLLNLLHQRLLRLRILHLRHLHDRLFHLRALLRRRYDLVEPLMLTVLLVVGRSLLGLKVG